MNMTEKMSSDDALSSPPRHRRRPPPPPQNDDDRHDEAVKSTADDAILAKLSCVEHGYYDDPFVRPMARGASGLAGGGRGGGSRGGGAVAPVIRRGTHARVAAVEKAIDSFLGLPLPSSRSARQVVVLGAGRDTTFLRYEFGRGETKKHAPLDDVRWFEVDHPSVVRRKATSWLPGCVPDGCGCYVRAGEDVAGGGCSYAVSIAAARRGEDVDVGAAAAAPPNYHLIGHDLRFPPAALFESLARRGYDRSAPALFVLECVLMYLPETACRELLRCIAESPTPTTTDPREGDPPFVAVAIYDPIPSDDGFGRRMVENLRRAGIVQGRGRRGRVGADGSGGGEGDRIGLEETTTLSSQLSRLARSGFDVAAGCDMMDAYDRGVVVSDDRRRAARCEMLDELEEFVLLMRHYCFLVGVSGSKGGKEGAEVGRTSEGNGSVGFRLCAVGEDSLMGFREGHCAVVYQKN